MRTHVVLLVVLGSVCGLLGQGCGGYRDPTTGEEAHYGVENLKARLDLEIGTVYAAAKRAVAELRLRVARSAQDGISAEIRATDAYFNMVEIRLGALPQQRTVLSINVGPFGDRNKSIVIFERIMANLSEAREVAAAPEVQWETKR